MDAQALGSRAADSSASSNERHTMKYRLEYKIKGGEKKTGTWEAESWMDAVNQMADMEHSKGNEVAEVKR